ncbi:MAG: hypothetical protein ACKO28_05420 [Cyanobium sp.]
MSARLQLQWRPFSFPLLAPLQTAAGTLRERRGWLLRLDTAAGTTGWGEAAPLAFGGAAQEVLGPCGWAMEQLGGTLDRGEVEQQLPSLPPPLAFAIGAALAEADGLVGAAASGWRQAPPSAWLLPVGAGALGLARTLWEQGAPAPSFKWKVGVHATDQEQAWYAELAAGLPAGCKLRLDANGGLDRATAWRWAELLGGIGGWSGWSSPCRPPITGAWRSSPAWCRWPWMNPFGRVQRCGRPGPAGRCGAPPRRAIPAPCCGT